jgi:multiple sugar transport system permease protein
MLRRPFWQTFLLHGFLILMAIYILVPMFYTFATSLKLQRDIYTGSFLFEPTLVNYDELFFARRSSFVDLTRNSIVVGAGSTAIVIFAAALGAYSLSRFRWRKAHTAIILTWLVFVHMLPPVTLVGPFYLTARAIGIYDTPWAVMMAHAVLNLPLAFWMLHSYFSDIPVEMEEAAAIDGCSRIQAFWHIIIPLTRPGMAATAVLVFVFSWKDFLFALSLAATKAATTIPVGIAGFVQEYNIRYGEMAAAAFFATLPALVLVALAQRQIVKGLTLGALKG